ncbi:hypothetical protein [Sodalis-like endosymbiont of Proechinophthirus fluctus]|uniref:hypothetical protein n=1 Tax=Sodalis-like endosymbiont of Proechinophthirus fluctus TaxID=1462730 RepID=UPI001FCBFD72|nr:hypothetical protein [Sodalis-like endosymbiont of Proechinophthirus fluctus]
MPRRLFSRRELLAIETLYPMYAGNHACINTLAQALVFCELSLTFHISDWLVPTSYLLTDRSMIGNGVIDFLRLYQRVADDDYRSRCENFLHRRLVVTVGGCDVEHHHSNITY